MRYAITFLVFLAPLIVSAQRIDDLAIEHGIKNRPAMSETSSSDTKQFTYVQSRGNDISSCKKIGEQEWDCTEEIIYAKAKKITTWYGTEREVISTAYTSRKEETDDSPNIAANGQQILELHTKGDRTCAYNHVPFGTRIRVGNGITCTVRDRINAKYDSRLDLYFGLDLEGARKYGKRLTKITILK